MLKSHFVFLVYSISSLFLNTGQFFFFIYTVCFLGLYFSGWLTDELLCMKLADTINYLTC